MRKFHRHHTLIARDTGLRCIRDSKGKACGFVDADGSFHGIWEPIAASLERAFVRINANRKQRVDAMRAIRLETELDYRFGRR